MSESHPDPSSTSAAGNKEVSLLEYWRILVERRTALLACFVATIIVGALITFLGTSEYRASTTLQIERQGPDVLTFKDVLDVDPASYKDFYQTQYRIIQSRTVLRLAVERLDLLNHPEFLARKGTPLRRVQRWAKQKISGETAVESPLTRAIEFIENGLSITPIRNSQLVMLSFMDRDPELSRDITNAVSDAFQQFNLESRSSTTEQATEFLTKEVSRLQSEIGELERQLQEYGVDKAILALNDGTQDISEKALGDLNARLTEAMARVAQAKARHEKSKQAAPESMPEVLASPLISDLKRQYAEVERRHTLARERFKSDWPALAELEEELRQARTRLEVEALGIASQVRQVIQREYEQAVVEVQNLQQQVERQRLEVRRVNRDAIQFSSLRDEIETRRSVLSSLVARQSETETSRQLGDTHASNIRVVDRAELPEEPARPRKALNLLLSAILGLGFGVGAALLLHHVDNTIKTERDIERYGGGVAVMGHVPLFRTLAAVPGSGPEADAKLVEEHSANRPDLECHVSPRSLFAESFKSLRTSLLLAAPDHPPRNIHITSCEPSEGKSTISLNLAIALTQMGLNVLLVDADLRRPRIHKTFGFTNDVGLSNFLSGNAELDSLFHKTSIPGLTIVTAGPIAPNPSELLGSAGLETFTSNVEQSGRFDHVIFDSPPVIHVADSLILAARTEATILVVKAGWTPRESLVHSVRRLRHGHARLVGAVLNSVSGESGYYGRYGYYYQYGGRDREDQEPRKAWSVLSRKTKRGGERRAG